MYSEINNTWKPRSLKVGNRRAILSLMREVDEATIPELSNSLNLSKMTIGKIINYFTKQGIILSAGKGSSTSEGGKKPEKYRLNSSYAHAISLHLFPGYASAKLYDLKGGLLARRKIQLKQIASPAHGQMFTDRFVGQVNREIDKIIGLCRELIEKTKAENNSRGGIIGIGIAVPGICDTKNGKVIYSPWFPGWEIDMPIVDMFHKSLGREIPILIDNEFRYCALAEQKLRNLGPDTTLLVMGGGGGLGSGILHGGNVLRGPHFLAGEIGHMVINPGGDSCSCGGRGCFEAMVHHKRVMRLIASGYDTHPDSLIFQNKKPDEVVIADVFKWANEGDFLARNIIDDIIAWFSIAVSNIIVCIDPDMVIIHGLYANAGEYFIGELRKRISDIALPSVRKEVRIEYSSLGEDSSSYGAAISVIDEYFKSHW